MTNLPRHRSENKSHYHYKLTNKENEEIEYFKTLNCIKSKYGISRSNIYLMCKNPETDRRKYNHLVIEKIHIHYLVIEQGLDPSTIH